MTTNYQKNKQNYQDILQKRHLELKRIFNTVAATDDGVQFFKYLKTMCNWEGSDFTKGQPIDANDVIYRAAMRDVYAHMRHFLEADKIIKIEINN